MNKSEKNMYYSKTSALTTDPLTISDEFLAYLNQPVKGSKTQFELDIEAVLSGNIDEFNIDALNALLIRKRDFAKARLRNDYENRTAVIQEIEHARVIEAMRIQRRINQLSAAIAEFEKEESDYENS